MKSEIPVLLYHDENSEFLVKYEKGKKIHTHLGEITLEQDLEFGDVLYSSLKVPFYVLKPNLSLLSMKVKRKTTIVYPKEAGFILLELGIHSGSKVAEVGTGSGAFTFILSQIVGKHGKVYSFEKRKEFLKLAQENLRNTPFFDNIKFYLKDVEKEGFGRIKVDALFIDVPEPWNIIRFAWESLKPGHTIGILSPNIEQIQKTHEQMLKTKFVRLRTYEIFHREILVRKEKTRPKERGITHTAYLLFGEKIK